jgi:hypothetical protein
MAKRTTRSEDVTPPAHIVHARGERRIPVSTRAVIARINRKLKPNGEMLKVMRGRARSSVGDYCIVNFERNWIANPHVDPEAVGRELGVLEPWEEVMSE